MASNNNESSSHSPMHLGLTGQFSPEDIQELLGVMVDGSEQHPEGVEGETQGFADAGSNMASASALSNQPATQVVAAATVISNPLSTSVSQASTQVIGEEAKAQARSERKRSREKQRRSDVNKQFADLTQLLQKIDAEDIHEEDVKNGTTCNRMTFNPSNRVDLIARTIVLLERLHEANKRRKAEIGSLQQQLEVAKKAGEDTAAKLKEAMLAPPGQPMNKQFMMMVPMMMSADGTGAPSALPMMNPFMQQAAMPQAFCPMPPQAMAPSVAAAAPQSVAMPNPQAQARGQAPAPAAASVSPNPQVVTPPTMMASQPVAVAHPQQQPGQPTPRLQASPGASAFQYMMPPMAAGTGGYMMPLPAQMAGQPMAMVQQPMPVGAQRRSQQESQAGHQEQKDSSSGMNGGSNLAHCA